MARTVDLILDTLCICVSHDSGTVTGSRLAQTVRAAQNVLLSFIHQNSSFLICISFEESFALIFRANVEENGLMSGVLTPVFIELSHPGSTSSREMEGPP